MADGRVWFYVARVDRAMSAASDREPSPSRVVDRRGVDVNRSVISLSTFNRLPFLEGSA